MKLLSPALLCHKDTAQGTHSPQLGTLEQKYYPYDVPLWHKSCSAVVLDPLCEDCLVTCRLSLTNSSMTSMSKTVRLLGLIRAQPSCTVSR